MNNDFHIMPTHDLIEHEMTEDCICGPDLEFVDNKILGERYLYCHHSLDGRELFE